MLDERGVLMTLNDLRCLLFGCVHNYPLFIWYVLYDPYQNTTVKAGFDMQIFDR